MAEFVGDSEEKLSTLGDETRAYIGRKKSVQSKYGEEGALLLGKSVEKINFDNFVFLDAVSPHVVFICGSRGTGKSYSLGCIAEELVLKNPNVASVIIDPVGIFWSMKSPNKEEKEISALAEWGLEPKGIPNVEVFIPEGMRKKVPKGTYDKLFSLRPAELTADDWCLTFKLDRFAPTGLFLEKVIEKTSEKYQNNYGIEEMVSIAQKDRELTSKESGYKSDTRRALISRLEAAKSWGVFRKDATPLAEICKEGNVSVIDISFLEENVSSLVIGMLARKILNARKLMARKATAEKHDIEDLDQLLNIEIPPTWLFIDEAHTLIPGGAEKTAATDALIEYVKQGRRPGCSLVFATQQPSAIDTRVLSQLDLVMCHKLVFDSDLKAVMKRMPTLMPKEYEKTRFLKTLPIGIALIGDRSEETSRAFCVRVRPRFSQHEGRETRSMGMDEKPDPAKLKELVVSLIYKRLEDFGNISLLRVDETTDTIKRRYKVFIDPDEVTNALIEKGCQVIDNKLVLPGVERKEEIEEAEQIIKEEEIKEKALTLKINEEEARKIAEKRRSKKTLGFFGKEEQITDLKLVYEPLYKVYFDLMLGNGFKKLNCYINSDYEFYYYEKGLKKTKDVHRLIDFNNKRIEVLYALEKTGNPQKIAKKTDFTAQSVSRILKDLEESDFVVKGKETYKLKRKLNIPKSLEDKKFSGIESKLSFAPMQTKEREEGYAKEKIIERIPALFGNVRVKKVETLWKPVWYVTFKGKDTERIEKIDGI